MDDLIDRIQSVATTATQLPLLHTLATDVLQRLSCQAQSQFTVPQASILTFDPAIQPIQKLSDSATDTGDLTNGTLALPA